MQIIQDIYFKLTILLNMFIVYMIDYKEDNIQISHKYTENYSDL